MSLRLPHFILAKHHNIKSCILSTQRPKHPGRISFGSSVDWRPRSLEGRRKNRVRTQILITPWMSLDIKGELLIYCWYENVTWFYKIMKPSVMFWGLFLTSFGHLQEFFFEHHVENNLMHRFWKHDVNGSFQDSSLVAIKAGSYWKLGLTCYIVDVSPVTTGVD